MGLLDGLAGALQGAVQQQGGLAGALTSLLADDGGHGGLGGLVGKFESAGLSNTVGSWIGHGENLPIDASQLQQVLGSDAVRSIAARMGVDPSQAASVLSQVLPSLVDRLTPHGQVPAGGLGGQSDLLGQLATMLPQLLGRR